MITKTGMLKIFYDGDCIFCDNYVQYAKLRSIYGDIDLVDLRTSPADVDRFRDKSMNVDQGMVVEYDQKTYFGAEAFRFINDSLTVRRPFRFALDIFYKIPGSTLLSYTVLVIGRKITLSLQGLEPVGAIGNSDHRNDQLTWGPIAKHLRFGILATFSISVVQVLLTAFYMLFRPHSSKIIKFGIDFSVESWAMSIILLVSSGLLARLSANKIRAVLEEIWKRTTTFKYAILILFIALWSIVVNHATMPLGRFYIFAILLPFGIEIFAICRDLFRRNGRFLRFVLPISVVICIVPGFWFGPFYGGIAGWVVKYHLQEVVQYPGIMIERDDGESILLNDAFHQPHTQRGRYLRWLSSYKTPEQVLEIVWLNYQQSYENIRDGKLPHQWFWGEFAYPTHNLTDSNASDYIPFPPDRIRSLNMVVIFYDWQGNLLTTELRNRYDVRVIE